MKKLGLLLIVGAFLVAAVPTEETLAKFEGTLVTQNAIP